MARTASRLARVAVGKGESGLQRGLSVRTRSGLGAGYGGNRLAAMKLPKRQLSAVPKGELEQTETGVCVCVQRKASGEAFVCDEPKSSNRASA